MSVGADICPYYFERDEYKLVIDSKNRKYTRIRSATIVSYHDSSQYFEDRYLWTGRGTEELPVVTSKSRGHNLVGEMRLKDNGYMYYLVDLGRVLNTGDKTTVSTKQVFSENPNTDRMLPVFYRIILAKTFLLSIEVVFLGESPTEIFKQHANPIYPNVVHIEERDSIESNNGSYKWEIQNPTQDISYKLKWEWPS